MDCGITWYKPMDTGVMYLVHPLPRNHHPRCVLLLPTVKATECPMTDLVHDAEHPAATETFVMLMASHRGTIVPVHPHFGGITTVRGGEQAAVWPWDVAPVHTPILGANRALMCGWLARLVKEGLYVYRCGHV